MEEKTEELRDIFLSVSDEETVTESQQDERGSLTEEGSVEKRLAEIIETLEEKFGFETNLTSEQRRQLIEQFYDGDSDQKLAAAVGYDEETVFDARMELHLLREDEPELDTEIVEQIQKSEAEAAADELGLEPELIERTRAILATRDRSRRVSHRFRTAYEEIFTDADLTSQFASEAHADGLEDATEGAETDVEF